VLLLLGLGGEVFVFWVGGLGGGGVLDLGLGWFVFGFFGGVFLGGGFFGCCFLGLRKGGESILGEGNLFHLCEGEAGEEGENKEKGGTEHPGRKKSIIGSVEGPSLRGRGGGGGFEI